MESVLSAFSELAQIAVRKVYTLSGKYFFHFQVNFNNFYYFKFKYVCYCILFSGQPATSLPHFFELEDVFFIYGNERHTQDDLELDFEESRYIQQYKKTPGLRNGYVFIMQRMPKNYSQTFHVM